MTTQLPPLPKAFVCANGLWAYYTADQMQAYARQASADLEAENQRLREALESVMYWDNGKPEWEIARAALEKQP